MGVEIERRFLVRGDGWRVLAGPGEALRQGYLSLDPLRTVRVRVAGAGATLTVKGQGDGVARPEFEWSIPRTDAEALLDGLCVAGLDKVRHRVPLLAWTVEVDVFGGANAGLVLAEIELRAADDDVPLPEWLGPEVTRDGRYSNASLSVRPWPFQVP